MKSVYYSSLSALTAATLATAHGIVSNATISNSLYDFYNPFQDPYMNPVPERISRAINGNGPVEDVTSVDMMCGANGGNGSAPAALHAKAQAGETVELAWTLWPESHVGPSITYMAKCPDEGCQDYTPASESVWFKVQEEGRSGTSSTWGATAVMTAGGTISYTIPSCLTPGFYLVRHELIALHSAGTYPGAQFYPGCHQLEVTGSGSTTPSDLVAFPGAYGTTDPGVVYNVYQSTEGYTVPGPTVFSCGAGSSVTATASASGSVSGSTSVTGGRTSAASASAVTNTSSGFSTATNGTFKATATPTTADGSSTTTRKANLATSASITSKAAASATSKVSSSKAASSSSKAAAAPTTTSVTLGGSTDSTCTCSAQSTVTVTASVVTSYITQTAQATAVTSSGSGSDSSTSAASPAATDAAATDDDAEDCDAEGETETETGDDEVCDEE